MTVDLLHDLITIWGIPLHISTLIGWCSGLLGLIGTYKQLVKLNAIADKKQRDYMIKEVAESTYYKIERIAKLTPSAIDDKLLSYLKIAVEAYSKEFERKPTEKEVVKFMKHAEKMATKDKLRGKK